MIRVAASFLLVPFGGGTAALRVRRSFRSAPCCRDRFQMMACGVSHIFHRPPILASVTLTVVVGGVVERLFVDFFLCFNLNFLSTDERIRMTVTM